MRRLFPIIAIVAAVVITTSVSITAQPSPHFRYFTDPDDFARAAGRRILVTETFPLYGTEQYCTTITNDINLPLVGEYLQVSAHRATLIPGQPQVPSLCTSQGTGISVQGLFTDWVVTFTPNQPSTALAFTFDMAAVTGSLEFFSGFGPEDAHMVISPCCDGPHRGFFGVVSNKPFTEVFVRNSGTFDTTFFRFITISTKAWESAP